MKIPACAACVLALGGLFAFAHPAAAQQAYPTKPIRIVVPYAPGGSTDPTARMVAKKLAEKWGQQVIVDNRPGGNTVIGSDTVAKATPDGYTVLWIAAAFVTIPSLLGSLPYDTIKDFDGVATVFTSRQVLVINPSVPANTLQDLIALAKSRPGQLNYASSGVGTATHLAAEFLNMLAGIRMQHIPYKGGGPAVTDLIGGQVHLAFSAIISVISHIKGGKLRAIAIGGESRFPSLPQVPTFAEAGLPGYDYKDSWQGIVAPAGTPKDIVDKLSTEVARILGMPDVQEYLAKQALEPLVSTPAQTAALIRTDIARYAKIIKAANIRLEN